MTKLQCQTCRTIFENDFKAHWDVTSTVSYCVCPNCHKKVRPTEEAIIDTDKKMEIAIRRRNYYNSL